MVVDLKDYQQDFVDAFRMEFSKEDIKHNSEVKKLAKFINRQGRKIDRINKIKIRTLFIVLFRKIRNNFDITFPLVYCSYHIFIVKDFSNCV